MFKLKTDCLLPHHHLYLFSAVGTFGSSGMVIILPAITEAAKGIDERVTKWRERKLGQIEYLYLDARYAKIRDCAVLIALGIDQNGKRDVLGFDISLSEAEVHWRSFLQSLMQRARYDRVKNSYK